MFKVGDRVIALEAVGNARKEKCVGTILVARYGSCLVQFDCYIRGHDGAITPPGRDGHCWNVDNVKLRKFGKILRGIEYV